MIRIRRIPSKIPFSRLYEIELDPRGRPETARTHITRGPTGLLIPILGVGDSWSLVKPTASGQRASAGGLLSSKKN